VQRRDRLRTGQRILNGFEQRFDAEIHESAENLIVMGRHEDARPKQLDEFERHRNLHLRDRVALIRHDGDVYPKSLTCLLCRLRRCTMMQNYYIPL